MNDRLFPNTHAYSAAWSTSTLVDLPFVARTELSDSALGVHAVYNRTAHPVDTAPPRKEAGGCAWKATFPAGSVNPQGAIPGGFGFYVSGPERFKEKLRGAREVLFGYSVLFEEGWEWAKGGKLPGIFGGIGGAAHGCTGGRQTERDSCFDLRLMWRSDGAGELYSYLPVTDENTDALLAVPPKSVRNPDFGFSVGRGSFVFRAGEWATVTERVRLNDAGQSNGEVELRFDGETVVNVTGLTISTDPDSRVQGMHFQTFFGGKGPEWASPKEQHAWFADVSGAIIV